jgi:hypothetical protein
MKHNLNIQPTITVDGKVQPYAINYPLSVLLAEHLEQRINTVNPALEARVAEELRTTGEVELTEDERVYIHDVVVSLPIGDLLKGKILKLLQATVIAPTEPS